MLCPWPFYLHEKKKKKRRQKIITQFPTLLHSIYLTTLRLVIQSKHVLDKTNSLKVFTNVSVDYTVDLPLSDLVKSQRYFDKVYDVVRAFSV